MLSRILPVLALLTLPGLAAADAPGGKDKQPAQGPPALVVRLASLDTLFDQLKLLGPFLGQEDIAKKFDEAIKAKVGPKGLFGVDGKRPVGFYARVGNDISDINGVLMVPVTSEQDFKKMLEAFGWEVSPAKDGVHTVKQNILPMDVQYRVAHQYAYVAILGMDSLAPAALVPPEKVFTGKSKAAISLTVRLDQIPEGVRGMFLDAFKDGLGKLDDKAPGTKAQKAFGAALARETQRILDNVLKDGEELNIDFDVDGKSREIVIDATLSAKSGSNFAGDLAKLAGRQTLFAGVWHKDAALNAGLNFELPAELRKALGDLVQEVANQVGENIKDDAKRKQAQALLDAIKPSITTGDVDAALSLRGPNQAKQFTLVAGFKLKDGDKFAATLLELMKDLPESEKKQIQLNADKVGNVAIHKLALQGAFEQGGKKMFGDHPAYVAFRNDALFLALGEDGLAALKEALAAQPAKAAAVVLDFSAARFGAVTEGNDAAAAAAQKLLAAGDDARMKLTLEGGPALHVRLTMSLSALKVFGQQK